MSNTEILPYITRYRTCARIYQKYYNAQIINYAKWRKINVCEILGITSTKIANRYKIKVRNFIRGNKVLT